MRTHKELAAGAAHIILMVDLMAARTGATAAQRVSLVEETIIDILELAQKELLESQRETGEALAVALNAASGK